MKITLLDTVAQLSIGRFLQQALKKLGHDVHWLDVRRLEKKPHVKLRRTLAQLKHQQHQDKSYFTYPSRCEKQLLEQLNQLKPELVLVIGNLFPLLSIQFIQKLKKRLSLSLCIWDTDGLNYMEEPAKFNFFVHQELPCYDHVFSYSKRMVDYYLRLNLKHVSWLPYAVSPHIELNTEARPHDLCFLGLPDFRRQFLLEQLRHQDLVVYGHRWEQWSENLSHALQNKLTFTTLLNHDLYPILKANRIVLNISKATAASIDSGVNLLVFDTLAIGGFLLTSHCQELTELFQVGEHVESFQTPEEMQTKVDFYLKNPELRQHIAALGRKYALKHHTWEHRARTVLTAIQTTSVN